MSCICSRAQGRKQSVVAGVALLGAAAISGTAGCNNVRAERPVVTSAGVSSAEVTLGALQLLNERVMTTPPDRFDPSGRLFGISEGERCQVFASERGVFMGEYPAAACAAWPQGVRKGGASLRELQPRAQAIDSAASDSRLASPSGTSEAVWRGAELLVWAGPRPLSRYVSKCERPCGPITAVAWSPDGEQVAISHSADPRVVVMRVRDGVIVRELKLANGTAVTPGLLSWSRSGLSAIGGVVVPAGEEATVELGSEEWTLTKKKTPPLRLYVWPDQGRTASVALDDLESGSNFLTLDPGGRYLFLSATGPHAAVSVEGYDLRNGVERIHLYRSASDPVQLAARNEIAASAWLPGRYPLWETIDSYIPEEGTPRYTAWRLYTRPDLDGPRLERIDLREPPPAQCQSRRVLPDGRTVVPGEASDSYDSCGRNAHDPSGKLRGLAKDELQRVDDGVRLQVGARGCVTTDTGFYSCLELAATRRYVVGSDPLRTLELRGDQLAPLLFHPRLLEEFLQGEPLVATAKDTLLGLPPKMTLLLVTPGSSAGAPIQIIIEVSDGGGGIGQLRLFREGQPLGLPPTLRSGRQTVELPQLGGSCRELRAYACNATGLVCSPAVPISPCR